MLHAELTGEVIAAAIEVHRESGPGLLESSYQACLCHELAVRRIDFRTEVALPVDYKGIHLDCGYRMDLVVADKIAVELKSVDKDLPIHQAQLMTYLRLSGLRVGSHQFQRPNTKKGNCPKNLLVIFFSVISVSSLVKSEP